MSLKVGIIGAGRIGKLHAENLTYRIPNTEVVGIADVMLEAAQQTAAKLKIPYADAHYQDLLSNPQIDVIVICSSTDTHSQIIQEAAAAGKHIFCEKPIDFDLARIDATLAAVDVAGVQFQVGFNRRFDPNHSRVRAAVQNGEIGTPHRLHIISRDPAPPPIEYIKSSGGIFLDMMIHDFDMARFLIGSEVSEIYTQAGVMIDPEIGAAGDVDTAVVMLRFENGVIGTIENSRQSVYGYDQRLEVFGSGGAVMTENQYPNRVLFSTAASVRRDRPLHFFIERYGESYVQEMLAFVAAITENKSVPVSGADGRAPVVIGLAAKKSLLENRPVRLSEIQA